MPHSHVIALISSLGMSLMAAGCTEAPPSKVESPKDACEFPALLRYTTPGCTDDIEPTCVQGAGAAGACASAPVCGCGGQVLWGVCRMHAYNAKYQYAFDGFPDAGACKPAEGYDAGMFIVRP